MGALADFLSREFPGELHKPETENEPRGAAIPAIPAIHGPENSGNSKNSTGVPANLSPEALQRAAEGERPNSRNSKNSSGPSLNFNPAALQREADRRNAEAERTGDPWRYCACGWPAALRWPGPGGRQMWRCLDCGPPAGRA